MCKASRITPLLILMLALAQYPHLPSLSLPDSLAERTLGVVRFIETNAPNFTLTVYPLSQTVRIGEQATYQVTLNSTNGFAGEVSLQNEHFPQELLGGFNPTKVSLAANSLASSTFTINTISVGEQAFYEFTILATSGSISQRVNASLTVLAENTPPTIASYTFLAAILLFALIVIWYGLRTRRLHNQTRKEVPEQPKPPPV